jgi:hypothetical protein
MNTREAGTRAVGKGRLVWGKPLTDVLTTPADFISSAPLRYTHRRSGTTEIYFVANPNAEPLATTAAFRADGMAPELWWPDSGRTEHPAVYETADGVVRLPLSFGPQGSVFVIFRSPAAPASERIIAVKRSGIEVLGTRVTPPAASPEGTQTNYFTFAAWIKPADVTELGTQAIQGAAGLGLKRNEALVPPHGDLFGTGNNAGCGLAVGTNGVGVFEHGASYFVPPLVHAATLSDWTHVAVVYRNGQPQLYLNGLPAKTGLKSKYTVHAAAGADGNAQFRGQMGQFVRFGRSLTDAEVAALARRMERPADQATGQPLHLARDGGQITALAAQAGVYWLQAADGKTRKINVAAVPPAQVLEGPWEVHFTAGWGAPEQTTFAKLADWTAHPDPAIKHFSGTAVYRKSFAWVPSPDATLKTQTLLDLGNVRDLATVRLNGIALGTLWLPPYQVDVSAAVKPGENRLEIEVVNPWNNRLVGDAALPQDQRRTFLQAPGAFKKGGLLPAGLLGPVVLRQAVMLTNLKPEG